MKNTIYILSGLGADRRVFQHLDLSGYNIVFLDWIKPESDETLPSYASRLSARITSDRPVLVGLSFGGMLAVELSKLINCQRLILISSAATSKEIPLLYRIAGKIGMHRLLLINVIRRANILTYWLFGVKSKAHKLLLKMVLRDIDPHFLRWALDSIVRWKNQTIPDNLFRIHGSTDRILPNSHGQVIIKGGGHLMVLEKADEVSAALRAHLSGV